MSDQSEVSVSIDDYSEALARWVSQFGKTIDQIHNDGTIIDGVLPEAYGNSIDSLAAITVAGLTIHDIVCNAQNNNIKIYYTGRIKQERLDQISIADDQGVSISFVDGGVSPIDEREFSGNRSAAVAVMYKGRYACGNSVGVGMHNSTGTIGALVKDRTTGDILGLTNNHVTGGNNVSPPRLPIIAPGPIDQIAGSLDPFCIGHHSRGVPMVPGRPGFINAKNNLDAAIFKINDERLVSSWQRDGMDTPAIAEDPTDNMKVVKFGRSTGKTAGKIVGTSHKGFSAIDYKAPGRGFSGVVFYSKLYRIQGTGCEFCKPGDSGSLVIGEKADGSHVAVGLIVGGDKKTGDGRILPIRAILDKLNVDLVTGHH